MSLISRMSLKSKMIKKSRRQNIHTTFRDKKMMKPLGTEKSCNLSGQIIKQPLETKKNPVLF
jgi:hypothetical protein